MVVSECYRIVVYYILHDYCLHFIFWGGIDPRTPPPYSYGLACDAVVVADGHCCRVQHHRCYCVAPTSGCVRAPRTTASTTLRSVTASPTVLVAMTSRCTAVSTASWSHVFRLVTYGITDLNAGFGEFKLPRVNAVQLNITKDIITHFIQSHPRHRIF